MRARPLSLVVACSMLGGAMYLMLELRSQASQRARAAELNRVTAQTELAVAQSSLRAGLWDDACKRFERVRMFDPKLSSRSVFDGLSVCGPEVIASRQFAQARAALAKGSTQDARDALLTFPRDSAQGDEKARVEAEIDAAESAMLDEARALERRTSDREAMVQLEKLSESLQFSPRAGEARRLRDLALHAIESIDKPWVTAQRELREGHLEVALRGYRACADEHVECAEQLKPVAAVAPYVSHPEKLGTAKLVELVDAASEIDDGGWVLNRFVDAVSPRLEAKGKACRAARDWACVDKQLELVMLTGADVDDEAMLSSLNAYAKVELELAAARFRRDPKAARWHLGRVQALTQIDSELQEMADRLDEQLDSL